MTTSMAIRKIIRADLEHATERVAIRLLDAAEEANNAGVIKIEWPDYLDMANSSNRNAARRHLTRLKQAGLIDYATNGAVYISLNDLTQRADAPSTARTRATDSAPESPEPATDRDHSRPTERADAPPTARERAAQSYAREEGKKEEDLNYSIDPPPSYTDEQLEQLCELGVPRPPAPLPGLDIDTVIDNWQEDYQAGANVTPGALYYRLQHGWSLRPRQKSEAQQRYDKYVPEEYRDIIIH